MKSFIVPKRFIYAVLAVLLVTSGVAEAQFPGGGGRQRGGGSDKSNASRNAPDRAPTRAAAVDPIAAIWRELPSLKADMKITPEQLALWDAFSASVREASNISVNRAKREAMAKPRDDAKLDTTDLPSALTQLSALADDDAQRAEIMRSVKNRAEVLVAALTPEQRRMFDRRIAQAQREPLGN